MMSTMRIGRIEVKNFKSLVDFKIDFPKFSCLIGLNGAGKSTVLQFIDFMSQLVRGDIEKWLAVRKWKSNDLKNKLSQKNLNIKFCIHFQDQLGNSVGKWEAVYNPKLGRCTYERIDMLDFLLEVSNSELSVSRIGPTAPEDWKDWKSDIKFLIYKGSILSALKEEVLPPSIRSCKKYVAEIKSLDLLSPEYLRQRTRTSAGTLGLGGENLASFVHELDEKKKNELITQLKRAYPKLQSLHVKSLRSGWKQLEISEDFHGNTLLGTMTTEARHVNDGMLRLIAILAELQSDNRFLLFDEIENGFNPELVEFLVDTLVSARQQVLVTTHSPMILNYLDDNIALEGVIYLYKSPQGATQSIPFFSIPSLRKKFNILGPGEVFVDTNLVELSEEIDSMTKEGE